eukprot:1346134-Pleurochrysis_carterae.AAC.1
MRVTSPIFPTPSLQPAPTPRLSASARLSVCTSLYSAAPPAVTSGVALHQPSVWALPCDRLRKGHMHEE